MRTITGTRRRKLVGMAGVETGGMERVGIGYVTVSRWF